MSHRWMVKSSAVPQAGTLLLGTTRSKNSMQGSFEQCRLPHKHRGRPSLRAPSCHRCTCSSRQPAHPKIPSQHQCISRLLHSVTALLCGMSSSTGLQTWALSQQQMHHPVIA